MGGRIRVEQQLTAEQVAEVMRLVEAVTAVDGVPPLNEHVLLHLRYGGQPPAANLLLYDGDALAGYAHLDPTDQVEGPSAELAVAPPCRGKGHGRALVAALVERSGNTGLRLWAHGLHPAAEKLATGMGFERIRSLWKMRRSLAEPVPTPRPPAGVRIRTFLPGRDEAAWVTLNARAFADHPEQGAWTVEDLRVRERESWFDPEGFFLAEHDGALAGFHWTKVHGGSAEDAQAGETGAGGKHPHERIGEVYVVGVDPRWRGFGLGRVLTLAGIEYLRSRGLPSVMLYVDEANTAAVHVYESLGFAHSGTDVMFRAPT